MQNDKKNTLLVPSDLTVIGDYAISNAIKLAKDLNSDICILHVINKTTQKNLEKENKPIEYINNKLIEISNRIIEEHNIKTDYISREGSIFTMIADVANEIKANYVIIGTHGKKGIQFLLGSFAMKVIENSPVPVLVVQKFAEQNNVKSIVFPVDHRFESKQNIKWAMILHKQFNAKFHFFVNNQSNEFNQIRIKSDLNQIKEIFNKSYIQYDEAYSNKKSSFSEQLVNFADEKKGDLIAMSTNAEESSINPFGSFDEKIIYNQRKIPVMCMSSKELKIFD